MLPITLAKIFSMPTIHRIIIPICGDVTSQPSLAQVSAQILQQAGFVNLPALGPRK